MRLPVSPPRHVFRINHLHSLGDCQNWLLGVAAPTGIQASKPINKTRLNDIVALIHGVRLVSGDLHVSQRGLPEAWLWLSLSGRVPDNPCEGTIMVATAIVVIGLSVVFVGVVFLAFTQP